MPPIDRARRALSIGVGEELPNGVVDLILDELDLIFDTWGLAGLQGVGFQKSEK